MPRIADPIETMCAFARTLDDCVEGTSCTQTSFKRGKKAYFYVGEQGGRLKAMFKLDASHEDAAALAAEHPDDYQVGNTSWVTVRFTASKPPPVRRWKAWMKESHALAK